MLTFISYKRGYYMGNFFTSIQIQNHEQLVKEQFIELFCSKMKENGFVIGSEDDNEISYALLFSNNSKWVSVASEAYEQGNETVRKDAARLAKMMNAHCINITVVDSDFAMLDMYSDTGKKLDTAVIGRADDYMDDEIPALKKTVWSDLLRKDSTWECFTEVQQGDYVFAEDGLKELAPLLGMNSQNILFDAEDAAESDENTCFLYFKKSGAKKKTSLKSAFIQVYGEALKPLGFKKVKGKQPYFVRVVNGEIIHIITIAKETSGLRGKKAFNIYGDIATVYRDKIDFSENPEYRIMGMKTSFDIYGNEHPIYELRTDEEHKRIKQLYRHYYETDNEESMFNELKVSLEFTKQLLLPYIDSISDIDAAYTYFSCGFWDGYEGLLGLKTKKYRELIEKEITEKEKGYKMCLGYPQYVCSNECTQEKYEEMIQRHDEFVKIRAEPIENVLNSPELSEKYNKELERRKAANIETLKSYGIEVK